MNVYHQKFRAGFFTFALASLALGCSSHYEEIETIDAEPKETVSFGLGDGIRALCNRPDRCEAIAATGLRVYPGDVLEIRPSLLRYERLSLQEPETTRQDNVVCVSSKKECLKTAPVHKRKCSTSHYPCFKCHPLGCVPWRCSKKTCRDVKVGERCVHLKETCLKTENQWLNHTVYAASGSPKMADSNRPMKYAASLIEGLHLRFELHREGKPAGTVDCPLSSFRTKANRDGVLALLENREFCGEIFEMERTADPRLSIINALEFPFQYLEGTRTTRWDGKIAQEATTQTFHPLVEVGGSMSLYPARRLSVD